MTTARELEQHTTVYCPMFKHNIVVDMCEGTDLPKRDPCRYFCGYGLWYVPGFRGRNVKFGVGCNFTHEDWEAP